jgi:hypothetical protein
VMFPWQFFGHVKCLHPSEDGEALPNARQEMRFTIQLLLSKGGSRRFAVYTASLTRKALCTGESLFESHV